MGPASAKNGDANKSNSIMAEEKPNQTASNNNLSGAQQSQSHSNKAVAQTTSGRTVNKPKKYGQDDNDTPRSTGSGKENDPAVVDSESEHEEDDEYAEGKASQKKTKFGGASSKKSAALKEEKNNASSKEVKNNIPRPGESPVPYEAHLRRQNEWKVECKRINERMHNLEDEHDIMLVDKQKLQDQYDKLQIANDKLIDEHKNLKKVKAQKVKDYESERSQKVKAKREIKDLKVEQAKTASEATIKEAAWQSRFEEQEANVAEAQEATRKLGKKTFIVAMGDDVVRDKLKLIKSSWKPWAKDNCVLSFENIDRDAVRMSLRQGTVNSAGAGLESAFIDMATRKSGTAILLNMALAYFICNEILGRPFFWLKALSDSEHLGPGFDCFLRIMQQNGLKAACAWRAQTLRLLSPHYPLQPGTALTEQQHAIMERMENLYQSLVAEFLGKYSGLVRTPKGLEETKTQRIELLEMVREVGGLALRLWAQNVHIRCCTELIKTQKFHIASRIMAPHASMGVEKGDTECDGHALGYVVEPPVLAYGDEKGENYEQYKVWLKATVLTVRDIKAVTPKSHGSWPTQSRLPSPKIKIEQLDDDAPVVLADIVKHHREDDLSQSGPNKKTRLEADQGKAVPTNARTEIFEVPKLPAHPDGAEEAGRNKAYPAYRAVGERPDSKSNEASGNPAQGSARHKQAQLHSMFYSNIPAETQSNDQLASQPGPSTDLEKLRTAGDSKELFIQKRMSNHHQSHSVTYFTQGMKLAAQVKPTWKTEEAAAEAKAAEAAKAEAEKSATESERSKKDGGKEHWGVENTERQP